MIDLKNNLLVISVLLIFLAIFMYWHVYIDLFHIWSDQEEYSHGFMIPLVAVYFLWQKKQIILAQRSQSIKLGYFFIILCLISYFIGTLGDLFFLLRFSFIFLLISLALLFVGYKSTKTMLIPILLLIFSFPLPPIIQAALTLKLQLWSSQLGVSIIRACNIPVYLEGNVIDLGNYQLQVVEACSGLRYLFPLMSLAFICAYLYQVVFWKRALVFLTAIPITLIMNSFRIGIIGLLVQYWGIAAAEGFIHDFEGWFVFMICFCILFLEMWLISWNERKTRTWDDLFGLTFPQQSNTIAYTAEKLAPSPFYGVIALLCLALFFIKPLGMRADFIPKRQGFANFPLQIGAWKGMKESLDIKTINFLGLSDYILVNFKNNHEQINFYAAYYQTQKHGAVPHSPKLCIPGDGWQIKDITSVSDNNINFNRVLIQKGEQKQLVYYWYKQREKTIANEYFLKWNTVIGALNNKRTDGALIRLTTNLSGETFAAADMRLKRFMLLVNTKLPDYIPD